MAVLDQNSQVTANTSGPASIPPLTKQTRFFFALGQAAEGIKNESFSIFLLFYYTNVLGLSGILAGNAILIALLFDAVTDPLVGSISDRSTSRFGRRHPFILASAIPLGVFFYLVFAPPENLTQIELFLWMTCFVVLCRGAMSLFHVPHMSLGAELSDDYEMRTKIVTERTIWSRIGAAIIPGILGFLWFMRPTEEYPDGRFNPSAYPDYALVASIAMVCIILISWYGTKSRIPHLKTATPAKNKSNALTSMLNDTRKALQLRSFRALFFSSLITFIALGIASNLSLHMGTFFWKISTTQMVIWGTATGFSVFTGLIFWERVAKRWEKKKTYLVGIAIFVGFQATAFIFKAIDFWPPIDSAWYLTLMVLMTGALSHFGLAATMITGGSMMADITDEDELISGQRREGIFFGASAFATKASFGVGGLLAGIIVSVTGIDNIKDATLISQDTILQLGLIQGFSFLILIGIAMLVFNAYDITKPRLNEIQAALAKRNK